MTGVVFNIQRFSIHDGPGIRTTVFVKGCPLSCWWCHNPESRDPRPVVSLLPERCIGCGACLEACPNQLARPLNVAPEPDAESRVSCARCGACAEACPSGARTLIGKTYTVDTLVGEIDKDRIFYEESGGGVTFSGGEPVAGRKNGSFLLSCLEVCGQRGYHRVVDTCGYAPRESLLEVAALTDLVLYDLKLMDDSLHRRYAGVSNRLILENLEALSKEGTEVWVRIPLIPGVNDDESNVEATGAFLASLERSHPVHLLPYHKVGGDKYRRLGQPYRLAHLEPPAEEHTLAIAERLRAFGLEVKVGG